ncbi:MAG: hypothetical protein AAF617_16255 [Bacteroidota bacterium]
MKKKSLKSLSLKKSNVAQITGGAQDGQAQNAASAVACPTIGTILTVHTIFPWDCTSMSCLTGCDWCDIL